MRARDTEQVVRFADMLTAMGTEPRLRIMRLLLSSHPDGMAAGDIQSELDIPASTLSHHLERLRKQGLARVRREGSFLWYSAGSEELSEILSFLFEECCTRSSVVSPSPLVQIQSEVIRRKT